MIKILIVDDEKSICDLIDINLSAAGYECTSVQDGLEAIDLIEKEQYDLILLDIMLPGADGYDIIEYIRPLRIPVIFITAKHEVKDRVKGLKLGAEDYLVKPFDVVELVARVEVVLRRYNKTDSVLTAGDVVVDVEARKVTRAGKQVVLTNKEYGLLVLFIRNKNIALFRETCTRRYGATSTLLTAARWISMCRGCVARWAGRITWLRSIRWDTGWRYKTE